MIHHIAIGTPNLQELANFYLKVPNTRKEKEWREEDDTLRSIWIQMDGFLLMIEKGTKVGPRALVFAFETKDQGAWEMFLREVKISNRSEFTIYFEDPDGNTVGVSNYPKPLRI